VASFGPRWFFILPGLAVDMPDFATDFAVMLASPEIMQ
jgi:hypothetical protein